MAQSVQSDSSSVVRTDSPARRIALSSWAIVALCLVVFSLIGYWFSPFIPDDSYISYRYAQNLASGQGLTFNPASPPVEAYSNFLWVVILAGMQTVGLEMTAWAGAVGWLLGALSIVILWWILLRRGVTGLPLALTVCLLAVSGPITLYAVSGLETSLFAMLLLALVLIVDYLFQRRSIPLALLLGFTGFLLALCRPEGVVALPVLALCLLLFGRWSDEGDRQRGMVVPVATALGVFVLLLLAYHVWRVGYFGELWPTPFLSKGVGGGLPIDTWIANIRNLFVRQTHYYAPFGYYYGALALLALVGAALRFPQRRLFRVEYTALILAFAYLLVYLNFADWMPGGRYLAPLVGLLLIPFSLLATELQGTTGQGSFRESLPFMMIAAMLLAMSLFGVAILRMESLRLQESTAVSLVPLGHWLRDVVPADSILAISDAGATPYYSGLETIDINPDSLTDRTIAENGWSADYFYSTDPDVVVFTAFSLDKPDFYGVHEELYAEPRFQETYERVGVVLNDWYQDRSYWVFLRRDFPLTPEQRAAFPIGLVKQ